MTLEDDHWNVVRLRKLRKGKEKEEEEEEEEEASKSEISLDSLHEGPFAEEDDEDFDADVLSNTSSEDSSQMNRVYDMRTPGELKGAAIAAAATAADQTTVPAISESFDTLSGSKIGGTVLPSLEGSRLKDSVTATSMRNDSISRMDDVIDKCEGKTTKLRMWHVIMLTSLVSMTFSYLALEYSLTGDVFAGFKSQQLLRNNERKMLYGNIDFVNKNSYDSTGNSLSQWAPSGKYYVDFDNHIAYPLKDDEIMGWKRYKADLVILWYTTKARMKNGWHKRIDKLNGGRMKLHAVLKKALTSTRKNLMIFHNEQKHHWQKLFTLCRNKYNQFSPRLTKFFRQSFRKTKQFWSRSRLQLRKFRLNPMKSFQVFRFKVRNDTNWSIKHLKRLGMKVKHSKLYKSVSECKKKSYFKCKH